MAECLLKNNFFEFNGSVKQQASGATIGTKCALTYTYIYIYIYIYIYKSRNWILKNSQGTPLVWCRYIDSIFFIWTYGKEHLETFLKELNNFNPDLKFTYKSNEKKIPFLDLKAKLNKGKISTDFHIKSTERHSYLDFTSSHPNHTKMSIVYSRG